jgi:antitoxin VapB
VTKTLAKLFTNGGSQAVRLPAEFRFENSDEVYIRRDAITGEIILSRKPGRNIWSKFLAVRERSVVDEDPLAGRPLNEPLKPRKLLAE